MKTITDSLEEIELNTEYPSIVPYEHCTFVGVAWNEEQRAPALLTMAREWFAKIVVGVQKSDDRTLEIAQSIANRPGDQVVKHTHYGFGDASMPDLIAKVKTPWVFVVAFDEMPDDELLGCIGLATSYAEQNGHDGLWIPFKSIVEESVYTEQHGHLRLFRQSLGWPKTMHSRPEGKSEAWWPYGSIVHERSLDEMMIDYLRYYELGKGDKGWVAHNKLMMHDACVVIAESKGWDFVKAHEWWPRVEAIAFK
jgi:hypothetical protein